MKASIVMVTYGQWPLMEQCLRSLQAALGDRLGHDWEIVVVDNDSPDETPERLREWADRIRVELRPDNLNFAGGCNRGAELAQGETLVFLNTDTVVPAGALETLVQQVAEPGIAAAGCRLLFPDGTIQHAGVAFYANPALRGMPMPQHVFHHQAGEIPATRAVFEADSVTAACLAVRRDVFFEVGGFETGFVNGLEDIDLCLKLRLAGHGIVYRGDVDIVHHEGASRGKGEELFATPEKLAAMAANDNLFISRWAAQLDQDHELAAEVWDASLCDGFLARGTTGPSTVAIVGQPRGLGPGADEARAFLSALEVAGHSPAALDLPNPNLTAHLSNGIWDVTDAAMRTILEPDIPFLWVPAGATDDFYHPQGRPLPGAESIVRLGSAETAVDLRNEPAVLASSRAVAGALISAGMRRELVSVMPSPITQRPLGSGGAGLLVVLPTHDQALTVRLLDRLVELRGSCAIRVLPTAFDRRLGPVISERLPGAELLGPCSDENRFAQLSAESEVVLAADASDPFERHALVAASVGTPALSLNDQGSVFDVLGAEATIAPDAVARGVLEALERRPDRRTLQQRTLSGCAPTALYEALERSVEMMADRSVAG